MGLNEFIKIGSRLKKIRISKKITQKELAEKIGIPRTTYANYEADKREPKIETLKKIANVLNVPLTDLISNDSLQTNVQFKNDNNSICYFSQRHYSISEFFDLVLDKSKLINLNFKYDLNDSLSISFFESLSDSINLSDEEVSFLIVLFLVKTNDPKFKIVEFYNYLENNYGLKLCYPNQSFLDTYENLSTWLNLNFNLDFVYFSQREIGKILNDIDEYKKLIKSLAYLSDIFTENEIDIIENLSYENLSSIFDKLVDTLEFNLFKLSNKKDF